MKSKIFGTLLFSILCFAVLAQSSTNLVICEARCYVNNGDTHSKLVHNSGIDASETYSRLESICNDFRIEKGASRMELAKPSFGGISSIKNSCYLQSQLLVK